MKHRMGMKYRMDGEKWTATWDGLGGYGGMSGTWLIESNRPRAWSGSTANATVAELDERRYTTFGAGTDGDRAAHELRRELDRNARVIAAGPALVAAVEELLAHYRDGRRLDVRKHFSALVAESEAQKLLRTIFPEGEE